MWRKTSAFNFILVLTRFYKYSDFFIYLLEKGIDNEFESLLQT